MFDDLTYDEINALDWKMLGAFVDVHKHYRDTDMFNEFKELIQETGQACADKHYRERGCVF